MGEKKSMQKKYKDVFKNMNPEGDDGYNETTELMQAISDLPTTSDHASTKKMADEHSAILQTLFDASGIKTSFNHDKVEQPLLDRKIVRDGANMIAKRAVEALKMSSRDAKYASGVGITSKLRSPVSLKQGVIKQEHGSSASLKQGVIKREPDRAPDYNHLVRCSGTKSADILAGLRQLAEIRSMNRSSQADDARRLGIQVVQSRGDQSGGASAIKREEGLPEEDNPTEFQEELHESDKQIAKMILASFLNPKLAGYDRKLTTDQVLKYLACNVAGHHQDVFKSLLKEMCELSKPPHRGQTGTWTLRQEFWPA